MRSSLRLARPLLRRARLTHTSLRPTATLTTQSTLHSSQPFSTTPHRSSSVNPSEVSHFNALASTWWDPHGSSRILHLMNPLRHDFILSCLSSAPSSPPYPHRYLDIGCGGGIFTESAARLPTTASVTGIDPTPNILAVAKAHASKDPTLTGDRLRYLSATVETLPEEEKGQYDVVTCFEVVEHVDHPAEFLDVCGSFVRPGGWLVLSTIARTWTSWVTTNLVAEDILGVVPKGTHDWNKYINEEELRGHFSGRVGWGAPRVMGVVYVPGLGWKVVPGSEKVGNYFFAVQKVGGV
ncbi:3-demethylubiquinone-9 3-O-methyltransferase [Immersiella caudata]|uniref:Ubiquinone biosynthesis O-methyltransferase, mitochondrial n=1 Tax=Immersiella caudata TaxID=314043 RepID=A0AA39WKM6_9PEZI|nr:3-demethylubiquinone-9 3-O-methyltransferase [Immersiella caudata]